MKQVEDEPRYECNSKIDGTKVWYYFNPPKPEEGDEIRKEGIKKIIIGAIIAIFGVSFFVSMSETFGTILLVILVAAGFVGYGLLKVKKGKEKKAELISKIVSDEEYDEMEAVMMKDIMQKGLVSLTLDEDEIKEAEPIVLHGYRNEGRTKKGKDGKYRGSENYVTIFYFTKESLYVYTYDFSTISMATLEGSTTLFYTDIVSVSINVYKPKEKNNSKVNEDEEATFNLKIIEISTLGGNTLKYSFIDSEEINKSLMGMQSLFREKKKA